MGYIRHNAIIITSWREIDIVAASEKAAEIGLQVLGPSKSVMNGYRTLLICPDGSKEGWAEKRILEKDKYPILDLGNGQYATHKMAWGEADTPKGKKYIVFPTVLYDGKKLTDYGDKAFDAVMQTGNYIEFDDPKQADWFSQRYKAAWEK